MNSNYQLDFQGVIGNLYDFSTSNGTANADEFVDFVNQQMYLLGNENLLDRQQLDDIMSDYLYVSSSNTLKPYFKTLVHRGKISKKESKLLHQLDRDLFSSERSQILGIIDAFKAAVEKDENLNSEEKLRMVNFSTLAFEFLKATEIINKGERGWRDCLSCLHDNDIKIGIFAAITVIAALAFCSGAAIASFGLALYPCLAITLGLILAEALIICGNDCFSSPEPECNNPICPANMPNNVNNGFQCCTDVINGLAVISDQAGNMYLSQPQINGSCPSGWIPDGIIAPQCLQLIDGTWENLTVAGDQACVDAICN